MNTIEPKLLKELNNADYDSLMGFRVRRILMICSNYDAFILEEDGQIETQIYREYIDLNLSTPPTFVWVQTSAQAREVLQTTVGIDMVICMYNSGDNDVFALASELKRERRNLPFVLLTHFSKEVYRRLSTLDTTGIDYMFSWHGNADLIVAIIKLFEDLKNADNDICRVGVQGILLVEDSVRYYSTYLPELYRMVLKQSAEFLKETLNEQQRKHMKRSRPKILLATNLDDAMSMYGKYKSNLLGVISDVGFCVHKGESSDMEKLDAGLDLVRHIKSDDPMMPVLLQSSQESVSAVAEELGVGFLRKYSKTLMIQLSDYIKEEFAFGDFVFRDSARMEYGRAANLNELEVLMREVPDEVLLANTSKNMLSKWFMARGLFTLGTKFKTVAESHFANIKELRAYISQQIHDYHALTGRGLITHEGFLQTVIPVKHACHAVKAESVYMVLLHPVLAVGQKEIFGLILTVIEASRAPSRMVSLPAVVEIQSLLSVEVSESFRLIINRMRMYDIHNYGNAESMCLIHKGLELLRRSEARAEGVEVSYLIAERSIVRMLLKSHDLQCVIAQIRNLRKDIQAEFLECSYLLFFRSHADMALIDQRMLTLARLAVLPLIWLRIPHLSAECLRMRILDSPGHVCRKPLGTPSRPLYIQFIERAMVKEH